MVNPNSIFHGYFPLKEGCVYTLWTLQLLAKVRGPIKEDTHGIMILARILGNTGVLRMLHHFLTSVT